jgi:hypothetical protein
MPRWVEQHPDVVLRLVRGQLGAQLDRAGVSAAGSVTSKSRCSILCCSPGPAGHTGRT